MSSDVVIVGAGHNALVTAAYLARAGLRTVVLERRSVVGGACVTEELWPGFRVSRAAYVVGLIRPSVIRELGLQRRGLRLLKRDPSSFSALPGDPGRTSLIFAGATSRSSCGSVAAPFACAATCRAPSLCCSVPLAGPSRPGSRASPCARPSLPTR